MPVHWWSQTPRDVLTAQTLGWLQIICSMPMICLSSSDWFPITCSRKEPFNASALPGTPRCWAVCSCHITGMANTESGFLFYSQPGAFHSPAAINWQKLSCPACCDEYQQNTQNTFCVYEVLASAAHILKNYLQKSENLANFKGIIQDICWIW